jgi:hypothetical protein
MPIMLAQKNVFNPNNGGAENPGQRVGEKI